MKFKETFNDYSQVDFALGITHSYLPPPPSYNFIYRKLPAERTPLYPPTFVLQPTTHVLCSSRQKPSPLIQVEFRKPH
jgi:hypothetical protein